MVWQAVTADPVIYSPYIQELSVRLVAGAVPKRRMSSPSRVAHASPRVRRTVSPSATPIGLYRARSREEKGVSEPIQVTEELLTVFGSDLAGWVRASSRAVLRR